MTGPTGVTVASTSPLSFHINNDTHTHVINGNRHPDAVNGVGITHNVDSALLADWLEANPAHEDVLRVVSDDDLLNHHDAALSFGFEPAINDAEQARMDAESKVDAPPVVDTVAADKEALARKLAAQRATAAPSRELPPEPLSRRERVRNVEPDAVDYGTPPGAQT